MANILPKEKKIEVLHHLIEGNTLRSTTRLTGVHRTTIQNLMVRFGKQCQRLMDQEFRGLVLGHVEVDETWTFCRKKQARLTTEERAERSDIGDIYVWSTIDQQTRLIPSYVVGKRSADNARRLMMDLASRLVFPNPGSADRHAYEDHDFEPVVQISADGFAAYPEAVDLAFGPFATFGTIIKEYRNAGMQYDPSEIVGTKRTARRGEIDPWSICTSHIERNNLTLRTLLKRFTRLSLGFSKKLENLQAAVSTYVAYYNYVWRCRLPGKSGRYRVPAAMAAGITDRLWSFPDLYDAAMAA
jgi:IS1 family transposase